MKPSHHPANRNPFCRLLPALLIAGGLGLAGCASDDSVTPTAAPTLEIIGSYMDDFGNTHDVTATEWLTTFAGGFGTATYAVLQFDNSNDYLVAQNGSTNGFNPDLFSRFDWADAQSLLYYCQGTFDAASEADAVAGTPVDRTDLTGAGCGGFAWSLLTPQ